MRSWPLVLALAPLLAACASDPKCAPIAPVGTATVASTAAAPTQDDMTRAGQVLDSFHAAAAAADEERYFAMFDQGGVFLGTDGKERWTVPQFRAYAHPRFATGKAWVMRSVHRELVVRGDSAWFDESLETQNLGAARGTGVLLRDPQGNWKVAQYNLSVPIPNEKFEAVKRVIAAGGTP